MKKYVLGFMFSVVYNVPWVVLIQKARPDWQKGRLNGVGGKIEAGEYPVDAVVREFGEETGVASHRDEWTDRVHLHGPDWMVYVFSAFQPQRVDLKNGSPDEPVSWYLAHNLPDVVMNNVRWMVPMCLDKDLQFPIRIVDMTSPGKGTSRVA